MSISSIRTAIENFSRGEGSKKKHKKYSRWTGRLSGKQNEAPADNLTGAGSERPDGDSATPDSSTSKEVESIHILNSRLELKSEDNRNAIRVNNLRTFLNVTNERLDNKKWTIQDDIGQDNKRKKLTKVCQNILLVKYIVNSAAATSPPAAVACAGITAGLLLFIQAMEQHKVLLQGLDSISSLLPRLHTGLSAELRGVLEFQSRAICYLGSPIAKQLGKDILKQDGWDEILRDIKRYDTSIKDTTSLARDLEVDSQLNALQNKLQQIQVWQTMSAKDQRRANLFQRLYTCPYKDRKDINNKRVPGIYEWFIKLLWVSADPGCGKLVLTRYLADEYLPRGTRTNMFVQVTADGSAGEVIILFDALDKCFENNRRSLIQAIERLFLDNSGKRNAPEIHLSGENDENIKKISSEINLVITERVKDIGERNYLHVHECDFISKQLKSVHNRTYLWVSVTLDVLEKMPGLTRGNIDRVVHDIPKDIDAAYARMLDRSPDHETARKLLHIVTAAERPLTLEEISLSLAVKAADQSIDDIKKELPANEEPQKTMIREKTRIRELCGLLLVVIDQKVYLFHQTAREFLWKHSLSPEKSHNVLAEICTLYLTRIFDTLPGFMDYAANFWAVHFQRAALSREDPMAKRGRMLCQQGIDFPDSDDTLMASYLGLTPIVELLLDTGRVDVESKDSMYGRTPLSFAAEHGHERIVKLLLDTGRVDIESKDSDRGQTPLSFAAEYGHERIVKLLLDTGRVDVESKDSKYGRTPLSFAAARGHEGVVKLLRRGSPDNSDRACERSS
ncbi:hypothetical protein BDV59DRAFT_194328 [Aspergillus ambiguus]|uniref:ankyrin repeat domain-containing protein n=1 Tax=Aspergillus ambiguus TaxID=176160 RepID=UPI003CCD1B6A